MPELKWTDALPAEEGWYFTRVSSGMTSWTSVMHVSRDSKGRWWAGASHGSHGMRLKQMDGRQWAGPVPLPADPKHENAKEE